MHINLYKRGTHFIFVLVSIKLIIYKIIQSNIESAKNEYNGQLERKFLEAIINNIEHFHPVKVGYL